MSWRRGDVWFEADAVWFGEEPAAPVLPDLPTETLPPGLSASLRRRHAWTERRNARRARAVVLAVSPAVIVPLAAARNASGAGTKPLAEDPPSLTFHIEAPMAGDRPTPGATIVQRPHRRIAHRHLLPKIEWHHATSVGLPYGGRLVDGTQLPVRGPDWVTWDPVTDRAPNEPTRLYGNERTIRAILTVVRDYRAAYPKAPRVVVGDISREGGGPMTDEHVSHQNGLDVDVYYPRRDRALRAPVSTGQIDRPLAQALLDRFVAAGAQMVFVGYSTGLSGPAGVVIPYANHENHMHVRFPPPG